MALLSAGLINILLASWRTSVSQSPGQTKASAARWRKEAMPLLGESYDKAERLAIASYRLERALHTDFTVPAPGERERTVRLARLRDDFRQAVQDVSPKVLRDHDYPAQPDAGVLIPVEPDDGKLSDELDRLRRDAEGQARLKLPKAGEGRYLESLEDEDDDSTRAEKHEKAGQQAAATAARIAQLGGREARGAMRERDRRVVGVARVCSEPAKEGHPCYFCSMLMARGAVYSAKTATKATGSRGNAKAGDPYHTNCDCQGVELWSDEEYEDNPRFDLNRELEREWRDIASGGGKQAMKFWRKHIDNKREARAAAQTNTSAQEAA